VSVLELTERSGPRRVDSSPARQLHGGRGDRWLLAQYRAPRDPVLREKLAERFLPLARHLARRYVRGGEPLDDLVQVASLGLVNAIDRFDPSRDVAFTSFAVPTIVGELKRHFRDKGWFVRVPRDLQELALRVQRAGDEASHRLGRAPTPAELADELEISVEQVLEAREAIGAHHAVSLDRPADEDDDGASVGDAIGVEDAGYRRAEDAATVERMADELLSDREREVLRLRFENDLTQSEIGARVGISQMQVSRVLRTALARLREVHAHRP
jgi:RNA polymerase sigma-B factor